jgi:hypothetical protein
MKKLLYLTTIFGAMIIALSSCNKNNEPAGFQITAQIENGSKYNDVIKRVRAELYIRQELLAPLASTSYTDRGFTLTLPGKVDPKYFTKFGSDVVYFATFAEIKQDNADSKP